MNNKYLIVGDSHINGQCLAEAESLFNFVAKTAVELEIHTIICLGDDQDGFGQVNVTVQHFFYNLIDKYKDLRWIMIVGNHSLPHHNTKDHSLLPLKALKNAIVVDNHQIIDGMDFLPYCSNDQFETYLKNCQSKYLFGHFTVDGAAYDNGFKPDDGLSQDLFKDKIVISGHIHMASKVGNVIYPGTPRWLKSTDANANKGINIWDKDSNSFEFISTYPHCKQIKKIEISEDSDKPALDEPNTKYLLHVTGNKAFCKKMDDAYKGKAEIKTFIEDKVIKRSVSESKGVIRSLEEFIKNDYPLQYTLDRDKLWIEIQKRLGNE